MYITKQCKCENFVHVNIKTYIFYKPKNLPFLKVLVLVKAVTVN